MSQLQAKAKAIDAKKDMVLYAGAALLVGLMAAAIFSSNAKAQDKISEGKIQTSGIEQTQTPSKTDNEWHPHVKVKDEVKFPFELKSQKLSH